MIHEITIENFGSVRDETTINFRVARNAPDMVRFRPSLSRSDVRLPTVAAFVGPNGSGKSTILRAVIATLHFVNIRLTHMRTFKFNGLYVSR
jgi:AAA15 family ATPase/GTPase